MIDRDIAKLQKCLGVTPDGVIGPITKAALHGVPLYLGFAQCEIGTKEIHGKTNNPRVIEYMNASKWGKWVKDDETPWCAGFVGWCMIKAGYAVPDYSLGAKSWANFGKGSYPVFGALAIKNRAGGGGHVGFIIGETPSYFYILGGNQSDEVSVKKYSKSSFNTFRIPTDYTPRIILRDIKGKFDFANKEE